MGLVLESKLKLNVGRMMTNFSLLSPCVIFGVFLIINKYFPGSSWMKGAHPN